MRRKSPTKKVIEFIKTDINTGVNLLDSPLLSLLFKSHFAVRLFPPELCVLPHFKEQA